MGADDDDGASALAEADEPAQPRLVAPRTRAASAAHEDRASFGGVFMTSELRRNYFRVELLIFSRASFTVNEPASWRGGNSLKVARNSLTMGASG